MATFSTSGVTDREGAASSSPATRTGVKKDSGNTAMSSPTKRYTAPTAGDGLTRNSQNRISSHSGISVFGEVAEKSQIGFVTPASYFEAATGRAVNTDGEEISDAEWIIADGPFPIAERVDDAMFQMKLLRVVYDNFYLVVDSPEDALDYTFFQSNNASADPGDRKDMVIEFEEAFPGSGLDLSPGIN